MVFVKIPRIIYKVLNFEFIIFYNTIVFASFCLEPSEVNYVLNLLKNRFSDWKNGWVALYSGTYGSFFLLRPSLLVFLFLNFPATL
jgi:hypothetical protein